MEEFFSFLNLAERKKHKELEKLRYETHRKIEKETEERIRKNPIPTETELKSRLFG